MNKRGKMTKKKRKNYMNFYAMKRKLTMVGEITKS